MEEDFDEKEYRMMYLKAFKDYTDTLEAIKYIDSADKHILERADKILHQKWAMEHITKTTLILERH